MLCMSDEMLKQIFDFDTSKDAWIRVEKSYALKSRARTI